MVKYLDNTGSGFAAWNATRTEETKKSGSRFSKFFWWFILFLGTWWLLGQWMAPKQNPVVSDSDVALISNDTANLPTKVVSSDKITANVTGLRIKDVELVDFKNSAKVDDVTHVKLLGEENDFAEVGLIATGTTAPDAKTLWRDSDGKMTWRNSDGVVFLRNVKVDGYLITVTDTVENNTKQSVGFAPYVRFVRSGAHGDSAAVSTGAIANVNSKIQYVDWHQMDKKSYAYSTTNGFIGFADQYWETIANIKSSDQTMRAKSVGKKYTVDASAAPVSIAPSDTAIFTTTLFMGPREQVVLDSAETVIGGISKTIDYGWFWFFARPILWLLNVLNALVMNYGVAIILMTILLRLLMWPLTRKSYTSTLAMQRMQPELQRIQKLYANDKMRLQMEMMNLYKTHKTSPMSGCLPMLLQIPIFFALYKALLVSVQMRNAGFLWIRDLAVMDPYFILPILMGVTMWLQQYLQTPKANNKKGDNNTNSPIAQTQKFMKWMPVLFTVMFAWMPAGLVLYWTVSNIFGIIQMYILKKRLDK